ncbi:MAG: MFS transporter [Undibacterium sp.]|nr:MFS transporter [Opitutaceae bacterium]
MSPVEKLPPRAWVIVGLLFCVGLLNYLDRVMLITMRRSIIAEIPMSDTQFGLLTTAFLICYAFLSPIGGYLADNYSRSRIILVSLFAWSVTTWLTAHATTFGELLATRILMGLSEAFYLPAAGALIADYHTNRTRALANGIHLSGVVVGSGLGGLGGWLAERHGWTFAFELFGGIGVVFAGFAFFLLKDRPKATLEPKMEAVAGMKTAEEKLSVMAALGSLFRRPAFVGLMLFWGMLGLSSWAFVGWMPTFIGERFGLGQGEAGLTTTGYLYGASLVGMVGGGFWADRWSQRDSRGRAFVGIIGLVGAAIAIVFVTGATALPVAIACLMGYGLCRALPDSNMVPILCGIADPRYRATGIGFLNAFATFVGGLTILAGGMIRDAKLDITYLFLGAAGGLVLCIGLLWAIRPREPAGSVG